ncbi:N-acetyltransferase [Deferribacterales bacterium Es71-Z0220]|jgi:amino-acid N-acetyltransferase|uniref:N-acetyltransferase n=1 Tax=Deferrivibrio essentukiensis TaxID=2880922 RepID=UPI001F621D6C|nr:N-acetyltransferase [Deferrivibrio essentukiensis]MBZ4672596.1 GCN5-related N-acetyltransferase [Deferribacteraceae bacterium]MCB4204112.1 N-acetyltransferase [Deferrivibrio essentukiensis]
MIRSAKIPDVKEIQNLVNFHAKKGEMLTLSLSEIYERIFEFDVYEENSQILGCCALHPSWEDLAEIRSLAVKEDFIGKGIGKQLVENALKRAKDLGIKKVFALTYKLEFFKKLGFYEISKDGLPRKIWSDCLKCPLFPDCDEIAVMIEL